MTLDVSGERASRERAAEAARHLNTALQTKMPMPISKSSTRTRRMISIMTRTKKPPALPGAKFA
jgi:hypothetical protein